MTSPVMPNVDPAAEALRRSETRYRRLFETARDGILLLNAVTAQIEDVNPYLVELLGYTHAELLGKKLWEVGAFADVAQSKEMFAVLQARGYVRYEDLPLRTRAGQPISVEFVSNSYDCGGIQVIQCNVRDYTAHHEAELVLRRFKAIVDDSDDAIVSKSMDGYITSWNPGAERLFGFTAEEAIGQSLAIIIPPERMREEAGILASLARGERIAHFETVRRHKDGHLLDISATISPVRDKHDVVVGASKIARSIAARKLAEATRLSLETQLRESQKMEAIGTLAGGIAHDFNNIIAIILGNAELALEDTRDNPAVRMSVEEIRKAASRARDLVRQILSFSRRQPAERRRTALGPVVEESVRLMRAAFPARVQIEMDCQPRMPDVLADATLVEQVLLNLGNNAMQAAAGGRLTIGIRLDSVLLAASSLRDHPALHALFAMRPRRTIRLTLSDDGPGMDEATVARIFEPFFTTKAAGEGTGLGLSVVRGIVQAHDGVITVASEPGEGTTFTIYLPALEAEAAARPAPGQSGTADGVPASAGVGRRLLYVDDDESLGLLVQRMLGRRGCLVTVFVDAIAAMTHFRRDPAAFDLVVSDYNMPEMSGLDVARMVRDVRPDLPVAVVSGFIDEKLLSQAREAGIAELLVKAADPSEFCEAVMQLGTAAPVQ
jgi:two-component system, cell cycle sensor histidine kinase and response regulator CckA